MMTLDKQTHDSIAAMQLFVSSIKKLICTHGGESHRAHFLIMVPLKAKANWPHSQNFGGHMYIYNLYYYI